MANAKQCDRCGKYFSRNDMGSFSLITHPSDYKTQFHLSTVDGGILDVCPKCRNDIEAVWNWEAETRSLEKEHDEE